MYGYIPPLWDSWHEKVENSDQHLGQSARWLLASREERLDEAMARKNSIDQRPYDHYGQAIRLWIPGHLLYLLSF